MAGIVWARVALVPVPFCWILIILLATRLLIGLRRTSGFFGSYLILPLFFLLGGVHTTPFLSPPDDPQHLYNQINSPQEVVLTGTLASAPEIRADKSRLLLKVEQLHLENEILPSSGLLLLTMPGPPANEIRPGDRIIAKAQVSRPRSYGIPGVFDYTSYLAQQKIWLIGWLSSPSLLRKIQTIPAPAFSTKILSFPERLRQKIGLFIDALLPGPVAGTYKAILIGDRSGIPPEISEDYKAAGNIHLLAISGLHIGLLAFFLNLGAVWLLKHSETLLLKWPVWKIAVVVTTPPLAIYAMIAGLHTPVFRAVIMTYIFMGAILWNRQESVFNNLALAALILLVINPADLFTVSFQLSFAAVGSIALILPLLTSLFQLHPKGRGTDSSELSKTGKFKAFCLASILISGAASLGTAPLLAYHFNRISLISPISTLLVEPLLCFWSLLLGLLACLFLPLPGVAAGFFQAGAWGIQAANFTTKHLAELPFAFVWLPTPSLAMLLFYYALLLFLFCLLTKKQVLVTFLKSSKRSHLAIFALLILTALFTPFLWTGEKHTAQSTISVLDVGQGLAIVVELPDERVFIIDGGKKQAGSTDRFDVGRDLIAPFLWQKRINKITAIIVSHPDADHANGIPFLIEHFQPDSIWTNSSAMKARETEGIRAIAQELAIPIKVPAQDETIYSQGAISLRAAGNLQGGGRELAKEMESEGRDTSENNQSLVLRLTIGNTVCLFPGDIEAKAESRLIREGVELQADILIAPHHGSKTSNSADFIRKVSPDYVVVSAGTKSEGKFPSAERMQTYRESGSTILTTAISGTVFFSITDTIEATTFY